MDSYWLKKGLRWYLNKSTFWQKRFWLSFTIVELRYQQENIYTSDRNIPSHTPTHPLPRHESRPFHQSSPPSMSCIDCHQVAWHRNKERERERDTHTHRDRERDRNTLSQCLIRFTHVCTAHVHYECLAYLYQWVIHWPMAKSLEETQHQCTNPLQSGPFPFRVLNSTVLAVIWWVTLQVRKEKVVYVLCLY